MMLLYRGIPKVGRSKLELFTRTPANKAIVNRLVFFLVVVMMVSILVTGESLEDQEVVDLRDPRLRDAIERALRKPPDALITEADMAILTGTFDAEYQNIRDLTGLEYATNLTWLKLGHNNIRDVEPLSALTNLTQLDLTGNNISDVKPLFDLTGLTELRLGENSLSNVEPLSALTNLTRLDLTNNDISDIEPLVENTGLGSGDVLDLSGNPLNDVSITRHIPTLEARGVIVNYTPPQPPEPSEPSELSEPSEPPEPPTPDKPRVVIALKPSPVAQGRVIFNEIRNAANDNNDWLELKNISDEPVSLKDWEVSIVTPSQIQMFFKPENAGKDVDIVAFPDYTLPAGGILLIVNTPPSDTDLISGQDISKAESKPGVPPQYLVAPEMQLPNTPYLLILRHARDKNGKPEAFEDVAGKYFRGSVAYNTQVWPL